jgi:phosphohistidine phosphatase
MKHLVFVRHAKSSWKELNQADHDRPLNQRGLRDAPEMAARLKNAGIKPDLLISSSALRAWTTASFFAEAFDMHVQKESGLYHAAPEVYLDYIHELSPEITTAVFFGHNPGVTLLSNLISPGSSDNIPTCGMILCTLEGPWFQAEWHTINMKEILSPKDPEYD